MPSHASASSGHSNGSKTNSSRPVDCRCGYILTSFANAYYPLSRTVSFSSLHSASDLSDHGFDITLDEKIGAVGPGGTTCEGSASNVRIVDGVLEMIVPGGQKTGGVIKGAELCFSTAATGGVFTMEAKLDGTPGTCQSIVRRLGRQSMERGEER